jgi:hypothetical protein
MQAAAGRANDELPKLPFLIDPTNALRIPDALLIVNISTTHNFYSTLPLHAYGNARIASVWAGPPFTP